MPARCECGHGYGVHQRPSKPIRMRSGESIKVWSNNERNFPLVCCNRECDCEQYDPVTDEDFLHRKIATCPVCEETRLVNPKGVLLSHFGYKYKDGRKCEGAGKVAVEYRKRPGQDRSWLDRR